MGSTAISLRLMVDGKTRNSDKSHYPKYRSQHLKRPDEKVGNAGAHGRSSALPVVQQPVNGRYYGYQLREYSHYIRAAAS